MILLKNNRSPGWLNRGFFFLQQRGLLGIAEDEFHQGADLVR